MGCCFGSHKNKDSIESQEAYRNNAQSDHTFEPCVKEHVFLDITKDGEPIGRLTIQLFYDVPKTAKNFHNLCTGICGYGFKGSTFHRIIPQFMCQGGDITRNNGTGGRSIYGPKFNDENFIHRHKTRGVLSMANSGPNTNGSQFFICFAGANHLNGMHVVFGQLVDGMSVLDKIEMCGTNSGKPLHKIDARVNERTPLLDPNNADSIQQIQGARTGQQYSQQGQKGDEQSEFSRILRQTAINVIDVTSSESQNLEQGEVQDRGTQYSNRLNMVLSGSGKSRVYRPNLPTGITSPQMTLSAPPVSLSDIQMITNFSEKLASAVKDIRIRHKESLVVAFAVP